MTEGFVGSVYQFVIWDSLEQRLYKENAPKESSVEIHVSVEPTGKHISHCCTVHVHSRSLLEFQLCSGGCFSLFIVIKREVDFF